MRKLEINLKKGIREAAIDLSVHFLDRKCKEDTRILQQSFKSMR